MHYSSMAKAYNYNWMAHDDGLDVDMVVDAHTWNKW